MDGTLQELLGLARFWFLGYFGWLKLMVYEYIFFCGM
jgi:hypothetical protein